MKKNHTSVLLILPNQLYQRLKIRAAVDKTSMTTILNKLVTRYVKPVTKEDYESSR